MAQYNDRGTAKLSAARIAGADQFGADALALKRRQHRHWRERRRSEDLALALDRQRRIEDVALESDVAGGDELNQRIAIGTEVFDQVCLIGLIERMARDLADGGVVSGGSVADRHVLTMMPRTCAGDQMQAAIKDIWAAYGGFSKLFAILTAAVVLLSWLLRVMAIPFGEFVTRVVETYRGIVHPLMDQLFGWLPWTLSDWWRDAIAIYFVIGGAVARTLWVFYAEHKAGESSEHYGPAIIGRFQNRAMQVLAVVLSAPLWPLSLLAMLAAPYVMRNPNTKNVFAGNWSRYRAWRERPHYQYICNLRTVFILQLVAVFAVSIAAILSRV